ncbi:MAG: HAD-IIIC family phosphatase [Firmicutes bacterium]|nr:HAD-IIIC family phosphatase [Bacillota bacterium]
MKELMYPFDNTYILKNKKKLKKILEENKFSIEKKIAILGGSTTNDITKVLELFLLNYRIKPIFYESEYNKYYEDAIFDNEQLESFHPEIIYIHTTYRNITSFPHPANTKEEVESLKLHEYNRFESIWNKLFERFPNVIIIQNNFEMPFYRLLGNLEVTDIHGKINYINELNSMFYKFANEHRNFYINDINYLSAEYGLEKWHDLSVYYLYKYALDINAIPNLSFNIAKIIKAICAQNKKVFAIDLDNTMWGGIIGDDGVENIQIGKETAAGEGYYEFQGYLKEHKNIGVSLTIASKNEHENALIGLNHPSGILRPEDFITIKANWNPKNINIVSTANEMNLTPDSFVFLDDNPMERDIVYKNIDNIAVPELDKIENYIKIVDRNGYFESLGISSEDLKRDAMYKENYQRNELLTKFENYEDYLRSLNMISIIKPFDEIAYNRLSQLSNKSNQFNLTTKRYSVSEIEAVANDNTYITLYGDLKDVFGDNGIVSLVIGKIKENELLVDLWIMSCRVLKRGMEQAMMDKLVEKCHEFNINTIKGFYYPTAKNKMVKDFYSEFGFNKISEDAEGNTVWQLNVSEYKKKNEIIEVK